MDTSKVSKEWLSSRPIHEIKHSDKDRENNEHAEPTDLIVKRCGTNEGARKCSSHGEIEPPRDRVRHAKLTQRQESEGYHGNGEKSDAHGELATNVSRLNEQGP